MRPCSSALPSLACVAGNGPARSRIPGSTLAAVGETCRTTRTHAGRSAGSPAASCRNTSTPPAEAPTTTRSLERLTGAMIGRAGQEPLSGGTGRTNRRRRSRIASFRTRISSSPPALARRLGDGHARGPRHAPSVLDCLPVRVAFHRPHFSAAGAMAGGSGRRCCVVSFDATPSAATWGSRGPDCVLVDRIAPVLLQLVREEVARRRRLAGRERRRLAVDLDLDEPVGRHDLELDLRPSETRTEPAGEQVRLRGRGGDSDAADVGDPGPQRGELAAPAARARPRDVRDGDPIEDLRQPPVVGREVRPLGRVDDEPVDDVDQLRERLRAPRRQAPPAQERRQVRDEERRDDARGRPPPSGRGAAARAPRSRCGSPGRGS